MIESWPMLSRKPDLMWDATTFASTDNPTTPPASSAIPRIEIAI